MLVTILLPILFVIQPPKQNPPAPDEPSPIVVTSFRWFRDRQSADKVVVPPRVPQPPTIDGTQTAGRNGRTDGTAPERDPNLDKIETRSGALDRIGEEAEAPRVDGFTYEVKFKNLGTKQTQTIFWEYQFKEIAHANNASRRRFICGVKFKSDKDKLVQVFSTLGPIAVINVKNLPRDSNNRFDQSIVIDRIEFEDGSVWQRRDWNIEEAKFAATKRGDRSGVCRSF